MKKVFTAVLCAVLVFCMSTGTVFAAENTMDKYSVSEIVQRENSREETEGATLDSVTAVSTEVSEPADVLQTADTGMIANVPGTYSMMIIMISRILCRDTGSHIFFRSR